MSRPVHPTRGHEVFSGFLGEIPPRRRKPPIFVEGQYNPAPMARASHGTRGRWLAMTVAAALLAGAVGAASASAAPAAHAAARTNTVIMRNSSADRGKYEIIIWVRSRTKHARVVRVFLTGQKVQTIRANPWWGARVYYIVKLHGSRLTIRTVNDAPAVAVKYSLIRKSASSTPASSPNSTSAATPSSPPPSSGTGSSTPPPPSNPSPPAPTTAPDPYGPYTNLAWEDNFAQDFVNGQSQPNQLPSSATWNVDNWGGCGDNTLSTNVTGGPALNQVLSLNANGLAINAVSNGSGGWNAAQIDSNGKVSFGPGSTIEARINMPYGQGLCPAFWMLSTGSTSTQGEIDIVEAPSFATTATTAWFTLHGPGTPSGKYEVGETALGSLANTWHNYGVTWTGNSITWTIDGVAYATANASNITGNDWSPFDQQFYLIFDLAVGGWPCTDQPVGPSCEPPSSATMGVQWVKVYN